MAIFYFCKPYNQYQIAVYTFNDSLVGLSLLGSHSKDYIEVETHIKKHLKCSEIVEKDTDLSRQAIKEVVEFLSGERKTFTLPYTLLGTPFQQKVWTNLVDIGYGNITTYKDLGNSCGVKAYRAVGSAMATNPLPLIVPCHRVLPVSKKIGNYSAGDGSETKRFLLNLEGNSF